MALTKCPDCGNPLSDQAPACPHCGRPRKQTVKAENASEKPSALKGCLSVIALLFVIGTISSMCHSGESPKNAPTAAQLAPPTPDSPAVLNDAKALDAKYEVEISVHCASSADEFLRSIAKYDYKWDETGFLETKFDKYLGKVKSPGVVTAVSGKAKLQNGFGAYKHIDLYCDYDTQSKKVLGYRFSQMN